MKQTHGLIALLLLCATHVSCSSSGEEDTTSANDAASANEDEVGRPTTCRPLPCLEDLCRKRDCGGPNSVLDEDGCYRPKCETDPCETGQECREVEYVPVSCTGVQEDGTCICGSNPIVITTKMCFPVVGE